MTLKTSVTASYYIKKARNFWKDETIVCRKTAKLKGSYSRTQCLVDNTQPLHTYVPAHTDRQWTTYLPKMQEPFSNPRHQKSSTKKVLC
jgi:hypothetical protein